MAARAPWSTDRSPAPAESSAWTVEKKIERIVRKISDLKFQILYPDLKDFKLDLDFTPLFNKYQLKPNQSFVCAHWHGMPNDDKDRRHFAFFTNVISSKKRVESVANGYHVIKADLLLPTCAISEFIQLYDNEGGNTVRPSSVILYRNASMVNSFGRFQIIRV